MSELRFVPTRGTGALLSFAAIAALNTMPAPGPDPEADARRQAAAEAHAQEQHDARRAIAQRYAGCVITKLNYDPLHPGKTDDGQRDTLTLSFSLTQTDKSHAARQLPVSSTFGWETPKIVGHIVTEKGTITRSIHIKPKDFGEFDGRIEQPTVTFEPREYPDGTEAAFYASSTAYSVDKIGKRETTAGKLCGVIKMVDGAWTPQQPLGQPSHIKNGPLPAYRSTTLKPAA